MGSAIKPTTAPITSWAASGTRTAPSSGLIDSGWLPGMEPPAEFENYLVHEGAQWRAFLNDLYEEYTPSDPSGSDVVLTLGTTGGLVVNDDTTFHLMRHYHPTKDAYFYADALVADIAISSPSAGIGTLGVTGDATVEGNLVVETNATVDGTLIANGALDVSGVLTGTTAAMDRIELVDGATLINEIGAFNTPKFAGSYRFNGTGWTPATRNANLGAATKSTTFSSVVFDYAAYVAPYSNTAFAAGAGPNAILASISYDTGSLSSPLTQYTVVTCARALGGFDFYIYEASSGNVVSTPPTGLIVNFVGF